jgi:peptidoglycan/LPS O-acetylase OafA/YrhL
VDLSARQAAIIAAPLLGIAIESFLRIYVLASFGSTTWTSVAIYWLVRAALFASFVWLASLLIPQGAEATDKKSNKAIRVHHDPLLGLRGMAFLMVLFGHWFMVEFAPGNITDHNAISHGLWLLTASPWGGVWVFFTLSGYLMGKGFVSGRYRADRDGITKYFRNRALRIGPLYFVAAALAAIFLHPDFLLAAATPPGMFNLLGVATFDDQESGPIGALWSVSTEVQFYFLVPFLFALLNGVLTSRRNILVGLLIIAAISLSYKLSIMWQWGEIPGVWYRYVYVPVLANIDILLVGFLTAFGVARAAAAQFRIAHGLWIGGALCVALYLGISYSSAIGMLDSSFHLGVRKNFVGAAPIITAAATAMIIFVFETADRENETMGRVGKIFWPISTNLGLWTYALYVWHEPVLVVARKVVAQTIDLSTSIDYFLLTAPLLFAVAVFFYRQVELPFDKLKRSTNRQEA